MAQHVLGIALDTASVTLVRVSGSAKSYEVTLTAHHPLPVHDDPEEQAALQREAWQAIMAPLRLRGATTLVALPTHDAVLRNLTFPFKEPRRIYPVLTNELDEHMPFEPEDVVADFHPLPPTPSSPEHRVLVAGMPAEQIAQALAFLQSAGLEPTVLDLDVFALANAALLGSANLAPSTVLLDVNTERVLLTLLDQDTPVFARSLAYGLPTEVDDLTAYAGRLSKHVQQTFYAYDNVVQRPYEPARVLLSCSAETQARSLADAMQKALELPADLWRLTAPAARAAQSRAAVPELGRYAVAFGMAVRGLQRRACGLNFRRDQFALHKDLQELRGRFLVLGSLAVVALGVWGAGLYMNTHYKAQRYAQIQDEISRVFRATLPDTRLVQAPVQLREKMRELEERLKAFGGMSGAQLSGLQILQEISARTPASLVLDIDTIAITAGATDLGGTTGSYDDVVKLQKALETSPFFPSVKITNTKTDVGDKISFKLTINTSKIPGGA